MSTLAPPFISMKMARAAKTAKAARSFYGREGQSQSKARSVPSQTDVHPEVKPS